MRIHIAMKPVGYQRMRMSRGRLHPPTKYVHAKRVMSSAMREQYNGLPLDCAVRVNMTFGMGPIPKSVSKAERARREKIGWFPQKPDLDNLEKAVLDAGNGILWKDDALVVVKTACKIYGEHGLTIIFEPVVPLGAE